jgi:predicted DNA-binding protein
MTTRIERLKFVTEGGICITLESEQKRSAIEVQFTPEVERKLNELATQSGRGPAELLQDALAGYFDEVAQTRHMLNSRYDDLKSGRVKPIPGAEVEAYFREKSAAARRRQPGS